MKILLINLFLLFSFSLWGQQISNNFLFDENHNIIWQTIIEEDISFENLVEAIETSGNFQNIIIKNDYISCEVIPYQLDYEKFGYKTMKTPFYISRSLLVSTVKFEYKEGRYRVTYKNITFKQNTEDILSQQGEQHSFEWWVLNNKGAIKKGFFDPGSDIMNKDFVLKTSFSYAEEDW